MKNISRSSVLIVFITLLCMTCFIACQEPSPPSSSSSKQTTVEQESVDEVVDNQKMPENQSWPFTPEAEVERLDPEYRSRVGAGDMLDKNYVFVFDGSGSMSSDDCSDGRSKIEAAKDAVKETIQSIPLDVNIGFVAFASGGWFVVPIASGDRSEILTVLSGLEAGSLTPLTGANWHAFRLLTEQARKQSGCGEYRIINITDGAANSSIDLSRKVDFILNNSPVQISTIGFCIDENHTLNQPGRTIYKSADDPASLLAGLKEVAAESETFQDDDSFHQ